MSESSKTVHIGAHNLLRSESSGGEGSQGSGGGSYSGRSSKGHISLKGKRGKKSSIQYKQKSKGKGK